MEKENPMSWPYRNPPFTPEQDQAINDARMTGMSWARIAREVFGGGRHACTLSARAVLKKMPCVTEAPQAKRNKGDVGPELQRRLAAGLEPLPAFHPIAREVMAQWMHG
jgi:hypothetical protein